MNEAMSGTNKIVTMKTKRERVQRWLVNQQRNADYTLMMYYTHTLEGTSCLVVWALKFANESLEWIRCVGQELATWLNMPAIILGLHFEAELGSYFKETMAWHNRPGPLSCQAGFCMMEIFDLLFGYQLPWWNQAVNKIDNPSKCKLPKTMKYLHDN